MTSYWPTGLLLLDVREVTGQRSRSGRRTRSILPLANGHRAGNASEASRASVNVATMSTRSSRDKQKDGAVMEIASVALPSGASIERPTHERPHAPRRRSHSPGADPRDLFGEGLPIGDPLGPRRGSSKVANQLLADISRRARDQHLAHRGAVK